MLLMRKGQGAALKQETIIYDVRIDVNAKENRKKRMVAMKEMSKQIASVTSRDVNMFKGKLLGSGGYGDVYAYGETFAIKFLSGNVVCNAAKLEAEKQQTIAATIESLESKNTLPGSVSTYVPIPLAYGNITHATYSCYVIMELVRPIRGLGGTGGKMIHVSLSSRNQADGLMDKDWNPMQLDELEKKKCRGYFLNHETARKTVAEWKMTHDIPSLMDLCVAMGRATTAISCGALISPTDVEFILAPDPIDDKKIALWVLDFGFAVDLSKKGVNDIIEEGLLVVKTAESDRYAPHAVDAQLDLWAAYVCGLCDGTKYANRLAYDVVPRYKAAVSNGIVDFFMNGFREDVLSAIGNVMDDEIIYTTNASKQARHAATHFVRDLMEAPSEERDYVSRIDIVRGTFAMIRGWLASELTELTEAYVSNCVARFESGRYMQSSPKGILENILGTVIDDTMSVRNIINRKAVVASHLRQCITRKRFFVPEGISACTM